MARKLMTVTMAAVLAVFSSTAAMGQESQPDWLKDFTSRIELHGYAQAGYSYDDADGSASTFNLKRTLFWAKARITDRWSFLFMHDFSSVVQEFYTDCRISDGKALSLRFGQFKHSFSMENPMSPTQLELIDVYSQAVLNLAGEGPDPLYGVNYGRDLGLMAYGDIFKERLHYEFAVMNGQGINRRDGNSDKDFITKLECKPLENLRIVSSLQIGRGHAVGVAAWNPGIAAGDDYTRDRFSLGAEWKPEKFSLRTEYLEGEDGEAESRGWYATGCFHLGGGIDAIASLDWYDRNVDLDYDQTNATAGIQYWFYRKCRLQLQYTWCDREFAPSYSWVQAQVQVAF